MKKLKNDDDKKVFVSIYYSFSHDAPFYQFDTEREAVDFIRKEFEKESRTNDLSIKKTNYSDGFAQIFYNSEDDDFMEWNIANLYNLNKKGNGKNNDC